MNCSLYLTRTAILLFLTVIYTIEITPNIAFANHITTYQTDVGGCGASASDVNFGTLTISALSGATTTGAVSITCPSGQGNNSPWSYCISIGAGNNSASASARTMTSGSNSISYNLYTDSAYTNPYTYLGNTIFTYPYSNASGSTATSTIYAMILSPGPGIPPGTYTDTYTNSTEAIVNIDTAPVAYSVPETCTGVSGANWFNTLTFTVVVTVQPTCTLTLSSLNFGSTSAPMTSNATATATIGATCSASTPYSIGLDNGQYANGSQRRMQSGSGDYINYNLYLDSGLTQSWSTSSSPTFCTNGLNTCVLNTGTGANQNVTIYGQVPAQSTPSPGLYSDSVVVTLTY